MAMPDTRYSLLFRLHDRADSAAWSEFCSIYEPAIYRFAKRFGLQDSDAREVSQEVLIIVSRKVELFDTHSNGRFRGWLSKIARNATIDLLRRHREHPRGGSDILRLMSEIPRIEKDESQAFLDEARHQQFQWAADQIRQSSQPTTWQAFWLTAVENHPAVDVARRLNISVGSVYVARCRTLAKIKSLIEPFLMEDVS